MENLIDWVINTLSVDGVNSKGLVKSTLEEMDIDDWYALKNACSKKICDLRDQGYAPESNPNIMLLKSYQSDVYQCQVLNREIESLSIFVKGPNYSGMPFAPSSGNTVEQQHINLIDAKHKLEILLAKKAEKLAQCLSLIESVSDSRGRYILTGIFLENKNLYQIMINAPFDLSYKQMLRTKKAALEEIRNLNKR